MYKSPNIMSGVFTQATVSQDAVLFLKDTMSDYWQITVIPSAGATGTIGFKVKTHELANWEDAIEADSQVSIDVASNILSFTLEGYFLHSLQPIPTDLVGSYSILVQSGRL